MTSQPFRIGKILFPAILLFLPLMGVSQENQRFEPFLGIDYGFTPYFREGDGQYFYTYFVQTASAHYFFHRKISLGASWTAFLVKDPRYPIQVNYMVGPHLQVEIFRYREYAFSMEFGVLGGNHCDCEDLSPYRIDPLTYLHTKFLFYYDPKIWPKVSFFAALSINPIIDDTDKSPGSANFGQVGIKYIWTSKEYASKLGNHPGRN